VEGCPTCRQLSEDWNGASRTISEMRRSAIVWDYGPQRTIVEHTRALYAAHLADAHHEDGPTEPASAARATRGSGAVGVLRRVGTAKLAVGCAVIALVVIAIFLHSA